MNFLLRQCLLVFTMVAVCFQLTAATVTWDGGAGTSKWTDATNWSTDALPTMTTYPVHFSTIYYVIGIVFALVSTFIAGWLPSNKAKHIDPVKIIRGT